jgi:hypothetical protein
MQALGRVATAITLAGVALFTPAMVSTARGSTAGPGLPGATSSAGLAVAALARNDADAGAELPPDFGPVMGYLPVPGSTPEAALVKPDGTCSTPTGPTVFGFGPACGAHDLGYDLLRYAARTHHPLPPQARASIDARFGAAMRQRCTAIQGGPACQAAASLYIAGIRFNSWRQGDGDPVPETPGIWLAHLAQAAAPG